MTIHDILTESHSIAALSAAGDDQFAIHGVLIGEGDVTQGLSGKRTRWPASFLRELAPMAEGKPITMADSLDPEQHVGVEVTDDGPRLTGNVSMDEKVGEITSTAYEDGVGILYEGFIANWEAEDAVESGLAQVSPVIVRQLELVEGEEGEPDAVYEPVQVGGFRDLAIVADGAAPSNEIEPGSLSMDDATATAEALSANFDVDVEALADGGVEVTNTGGDDGPSGDAGNGKGSSTRPSDWRTTMDEDLSDRQRELLARAAQMDDPTVVEADEYDELSEHEELIDEAEDLTDPTVESETEVEAMRNRLGTVEAMFDEALIEEKDLRESTVEAMSFEAKAAEFETDEGDLDIEALTQQPETGSAPSDDGEDGDVDLEALSSDERDEVDSLLTRAETFDSVDPDHAEALRDEAAEIAGAEETEDLLEVL